MIRVRYEYDHGLALDDGNEFWCDDLGRFGAPVSLIEPVSLTSLRNALARHADVWGPGDAELWVSLDGPERFHDETSEALPYRLVVRDAQLALAIYAEALPAELTAEDIRTATTGVLRRSGADLVEVEPPPPGDEDEFTRILIRIPAPRRSAGKAFRLAEEMLATLELHFNETPSRDWVARVLQQGVWDLLCDLEETGWLEAKREHYRKDPRDELNFASDVAALCNAEGGVLIIGAKTKRQPDGDRITAINQCPLHPETVRRYTQLLGRLVFPAPIGVQIVALHDPARKASGLLVVNVPPQPRESRPFLVGGALIGDSVHRAMVGIPIRRGADTDWMHIAGLHARLRLGRSALGD